MIHHPVMVHEVITALVTDPHGCYLDVTCGGGGHSEALLTQFPHVTLIASDWDHASVKRTEERLASFVPRVVVAQSAFSDLFFLLKHYAIASVQGILADFGTSMFQLKEGEGFSFLSDTFLDMRMSKAHRKITAYDIVNYASEEELAHIFFTYGEEHEAKKIARAIGEARREKKIKTGKALGELVAKVKSGYSKIHPATKIFQALRIQVNREYEEITALLTFAVQHLSVGGRVVCLTFHSGEDRLVKAFFNKNPQYVSVGNLQTASLEECAQNRSARSAKMRVFERIIDR